MSTLHASKSKKQVSRQFRDHPNNPANQPFHPPAGSSSKNSSKKKGK